MKDKNHYKLRARLVNSLRKKVEKLQESEKRYQDLYEDAPDMYFTVTPDGIIKSVNEFGANCLGYTKEKLISKPVWLIVHADDFKKIQKQVKEIFDKRIERSHLEFRKVRKDGSVLWVQERTRLILDKKNNPVELRIMCRDITQQRKADEKLKQQREKSEKELKALKKKLRM